MCVLFQDVLSFVVNNMIDPAEFPLLKSMFEVFYLFKLQYQL